MLFCWFIVHYLLRQKRNRGYFRRGGHLYAPRVRPAHNPACIAFCKFIPGCWFRVFPWKKRKVFQVSVCFHEHKWLKLTNKALFQNSQMYGRSMLLSSNPEMFFFFVDFLYGENTDKKILVSTDISLSFPRVIFSPKRLVRSFRGVNTFSCSQHFS